MKCARLLFTPALVVALLGTAYGQQPMMDPAMMGAACPPMAGGPVYSDCPPDVGRWAGGGRVYQCTSRGYFSADAFMAFRKDEAPRNLATIGGVRALNTADPDFGMEVAPRIIAGYVLPNDLAVEFTGFYKDDFDAIADATSPIPPGVNLVGATALGLAGAGSDYIGANNMNLRLSTQIHSYEVNLVETSRVFRFTTGLRYMEVSDVMNLRTTQLLDRSDFRIGTYNHLYGGQFGLRTGYDWELLGFEVAGKAGYFINDGQSTTFIRNNNNTTVVRNVRTAGQNDAFAGELTAKISYRPLPYLAIQGGYQAFWITETALAPDQITSGARANTGLALNAHGDVFYHGPSVGVELRW